LLIGNGHHGSLAGRFERRDDSIYRESRFRTAKDLINLTSGRSWRISQW
jgi:hypothetical protein